MASNSTTMKYLKTNNDEAESIILQQSVTPSNFDESSAPKRVSYGQYLKNNAYNSEAHSLISPSKSEKPDKLGDSWKTPKQVAQTESRQHNSRVINNSFNKS
jgi:hypothetical protein